MCSQFFLLDPHCLCWNLSHSSVQKSSHWSPCPLLHFPVTRLIMSLPISTTAWWWWWWCQLWLTFIECSLHVRQYCNFNLPTSLLIKDVLLISPLCRWWKLGPQGLYKFSRSIQPFSGGARLSPRTMACSLIAYKLLVIWAGAPSPATFSPQVLQPATGPLPILFPLENSHPALGPPVLASETPLAGVGAGWPRAYESPRTLGKWSFPGLNPKIVI